MSIVSDLQRVSQSLAQGRIDRRNVTITVNIEEGLELDRLFKAERGFINVDDYWNAHSSARWWNTLTRLRMFGMIIEVKDGPRTFQ
jgi:hypothetical protein